MQASAKRKTIAIKGITQLEEKQDNLIHLTHKKSLGG
jgi:hypothetical protein